MPRPKPIDPKIRLHVVLPSALYARLKLIFYSTAYESGVMKGAISDFITAAVQEKLERSKQ